MLLNYNPSWKNFPVKNNIPVYRRKIRSENGKIKVQHCGQHFEIKDIDVMGAEELFNGNLIIRTVDGRECFIWKEDGWKVDCFDGLGNLVETLEAKNGR